MVSSNQMTESSDAPAPFIYSYHRGLECLSLCIFLSLMRFCTHVSGNPEFLHVRDLNQKLNLLVVPALKSRRSTPDSIFSGNIHPNFKNQASRHQIDSKWYVSAMIWYWLLHQITFDSIRPAGFWDFHLMKLTNHSSSTSVFLRIDLH